MTAAADPSRTLQKEGIRGGAQKHGKLSEAVLYKEAIRRQEGLPTAAGPLVTLAAGPRA